MNFFPQTGFNGFGTQPSNGFNGFNQPWNQQNNTYGQFPGNWNNQPWNWQNTTTTPWSGFNNWNQSPSWNTGSSFGGFNQNATPFSGDWNSTNWNNSFFGNTPWNTNGFSGFGGFNTPSAFGGFPGFWQGQSWNGTTPSFGASNWGGFSPFGAATGWNQSFPFGGVPFAGVPFGWWNQSPVTQTETNGSTEQSATTPQGNGAYPYPFAAFNPFFCFNPQGATTCNGTTQAA